VINRRWTDPASTDDLGALDLDAIAGVADEAWPQARNSDEMQEALVALACITQDEAAAKKAGTHWLEALAESGRATCLRDRRRQLDAWGGAGKARLPAGRLSRCGRHAGAGDTRQPPRQRRR
jgi:ATP-dependent Lhr-like helicase